jgi:hypothetical protein
VFPTLECAITELPADGLRRYRRRVRAELPATKTSIHRGRQLVAQWLTAWSRVDFIHAVSIVATELLEMAVANCRVWGTYTSAAGNTVWAVVGPENRF